MGSGGIKERKAALQKRQTKSIGNKLSDSIHINRFTLEKASIKQVLLIFVVLICIFTVVFLFRLLFGPDNRNTAEGVSYLKKLEAQDIKSTESRVKEVRKASQAKAVEEGTLSVWAQFNDYVIFGDSRTVGFSFHEFLDAQRVMAEGGLTIRDIPNYVQQMKVLNPGTLILCTGLNDVSIGYWPTPEEYIKEYEEQMEHLSEELPNTHVYINSIFPAQDPAFEKEDSWIRIPEYNEAVKAWCKEKGYSYIDNSSVYEEHKDLYDIDGIHFRKDFYQYWAINILAEVDM